VAISINVQRIVAVRSLPGAALGAIVPLVAMLMDSTLGLMPQQPRWVLGAELLVVGIAAWSIGGARRPTTHIHGHPAAVALSGFLRRHSSMRPVHADASTYL
jgi:hypothetical protein